eukprot:500876_1
MRELDGGNTLEPLSSIGNSGGQQCTGEGTDHDKVKEVNMTEEKCSGGGDTVTTQPVALQRSRKSSKSKNSKSKRERVLINSSMTDQGIDERSKDDTGKLLRDQTDLLLQNQQQTNEGHKFWDTQPVPKLFGDGDEAGKGTNGPIEVGSVDEVRATTYPLPQGFLWCEVNVLSDSEVDELYSLLSDNYVEDDDCIFRFNYSIDFLRWALTAYGYSQELHVGVRNERNGKLLGFISGVPAVLSVEGEVVRVVEVNFLCVHKKLRSKRLAPVLIKELTRRVNLGGVWQAVYTGGIVIPTPMASSRYYHRSLKPKKTHRSQL